MPWRRWSKRSWTGRFEELSWRRVLEAAEGVSPTRELVVAQPRLDFGSMAPAAAPIAALRAEAADLDITAEEGLRLSLTGAAVLDTEELESVGSGALLASVLSTLAVAALLVWGLRSLRLIAATLLTLAVGLVLTACFATLSIGRLNLMSVTFAVLFVGLGIDFGIHLALRFQEALAGEVGERAALRAATAGVGGPLSLSALCAGCGFLAFVPTDYQGLAELGIIATAGMAIAWLLNLTLLPALLAMMRPHVRPVEMPRARAPTAAPPGVGRRHRNPRRRRIAACPVGRELRLQSPEPQGPTKRVHAHVRRSRGGPGHDAARHRCSRTQPGAGRRARRPPGGAEGGWRRHSP